MKEINRCDICKRELGIKEKTVWLLAFYRLPEYKVCKECDLCLEEQIWEILDFRTDYLKELGGRKI